MTTPKANPAYQHIAKAISDYLIREGITMGELGTRLGINGVNPSSNVSTWVRMRGRPGPGFQPKLAKLLGVEEDFFRPAGKTSKPKLGPARQALMLVPKKELVPNSPAEAKLLRLFEEHSDGTVTVKLNARLPTPKAMEVFKILMDVK